MTLLRKLALALVEVLLQGDSYMYPKKLGSFLLESIHRLTTVLTYYCEVLSDWNPVPGPEHAELGPGDVRPSLQFELSDRERYQIST